MRTVTSIFSLVSLAICLVTPLDVKLVSNTNKLNDFSSAISNGVKNAVNGAKDALIGTLSNGANSNPPKAGNIAHILLANICNMKF